MGLFNKGAGVVVPLVFSTLVLSGVSGHSDAAIAAMGTAEKDALRALLSARLVFPYAVMAGALVLIMLLVRLSPLGDIEEEGGGAPVKRFGVLQFPQLVLGALALFAYVGVEVIAGDTIGLYGRHFDVHNFGVLTSYTMGFMVLGYAVGTLAIPRYLSQKNALLLSAACGIVFTFGVATGSSTATMVSNVLVGWAGVPLVPDTVMFLAMLGLANALVWPSIWPLALEGLGKYTASGSALLIMGIAGGALLPILYGKMSDAFNAQGAYWILLPCYGLILFYAVHGHRMTRWK
jgi:FHS family L-fucose permease-like MFS transporter